MIYEISIALVIAFGGGQTSVQLDIDPTFLIAGTTPASAIAGSLGIPSAHGGFGMALPHLIFLDDDAIERYNRSWRDACRDYGACDYERVSRDLILREELLHTEQISALGPGFFLAYAGTLGEAFEPYSPRDDDVAFDWDNMWLPGPELAGSCPLFRLRFDAGASEASLLPCYEVLRFGAN